MAPICASFGRRPIQVAPRNRSILRGAVPAYWVVRRHCGTYTVRPLVASDCQSPRLLCQACRRPQQRKFSSFSCGERLNSRTWGAHRQWHAYYKSTLQPAHSSQTVSGVFQYLCRPHRSKLIFCNSRYYFSVARCCQQGPRHVIWSLESMRLPRWALNVGLHGCEKTSRTFRVNLHASIRS